MPVMGMIPMFMPDVDEDLEQEHRDDAAGDQRAEEVLRPSVRMRSARQMSSA